MTAHTTPLVASYRLADTTIADTRDETSQALLAQAHRNRERPLCGCVGSGVPMYVARSGRHFIVKRMPGTGAAHARTCTSWLPPEDLSGLGQVLGHAIADDPDSGLTALRLDFALSQSSGRAAPATATGATSDAVAADGTKLTLRAMLHYLWDDAGFSSWTPRMHGKRNWRVVSWNLRETVRTKVAKGVPLASKLFVPEPFDPAQKTQIAARRIAAWAPARTQRGGATPLLMLVGEVKDIAPSRFGHKIVVKHMPGAPIMLDDDIHRRMTRSFADDLALWNADDGHHLIMIATFSVGRTGLASAVRLALMCTDTHWLPIASDYDHLLITEAVRQHRRFTVGMRYNLGPEKPLATLTLTDTDPPTAMHYSGDDAGEFADLITAEGLHHWHWTVGDPLPPFPPSAENPTADDLSPRTGRSM